MKVPVIKTCAYSSVNRMIHIFKHVFKGIKNKDKNAFGPRRPTWPELIPCSFRSMKQLRVLLLPPGRDASPSQGYPPAVCRQYPFIHLGEERQFRAKYLV